MIASPLRPRHRQEQGIAAASRLAHRGTPYGASLSFATTTHLWPLSDPPSRKPTSRPVATSRQRAARSIPGRALASSMLDSPCQGSRTGLTPPISTSVPSTLGDGPDGRRQIGSTRAGGGVCSATPRGAPEPMPPAQPEEALSPALGEDSAGSRSASSSPTPCQGCSSCSSGAGTRSAAPVASARIGQAGALLSETASLGEPPRSYVAKRTQVSCCVAVEPACPGSAGRARTSSSARPRRLVTATTST